MEKVGERLFVHDRQRCIDRFEDDNSTRETSDRKLLKLWISPSKVTTTGRATSNRKTIEMELANQRSKKKARFHYDLMPAAGGDRCREPTLAQAPKSLRDARMNTPATPSHFPHHQCQPPPGLLDKGVVLSMRE